jgi:hypothetical protein
MSIIEIIANACLVYLMIMTKRRTKYNPRPDAFFQSVGEDSALR